MFYFLNYLNKFKAENIERHSSLDKLLLHFKLIFGILVKTISVRWHCSRHLLGSLNDFN